MANRKDDLVSFDEFVESQQATESDKKYYATQLEEWRAYIGDFYHRVESYLSKYVRDGKISINREQEEIYEENIGNYSVDKMLVYIGRTTVIIQPIATLLIGSKGRIDMSGPSGIARFALVDRGASSAASMVRVTINKAGGAQSGSNAARREIDWVWKIIDQNKMPLVFNELNEENFFKALMGVARA